ncbi:MAG: class I SAM-dependent methyltransferase [Pseudomonadales bacterium]|nr:class I SAM-dependent methyltransferase [Pseudomonadales bacterium]
MSRFFLQKSPAGLVLTDSVSGQKPLLIDFASGAVKHRVRQGGKKELLLKAIGSKKSLRILDCTAGLGMDAFLMAFAGHRVVMTERSVVLAALLEDALQRGAEDEFSRAAVSRMTLLKGDAADALAKPGFHPDVIYIDQMFPARRKSAEVKGEMQMLQRFLGHDGEVGALLAQAARLRPGKIVVKRPAQDEAYTDMTPDHVYMAKANRFDVFVFSQKSGLP